MKQSLNYIKEIITDFTLISFLLTKYLKIRLWKSREDLQTISHFGRVMEIHYKYIITIQCQIYQRIFRDHGFLRHSVVKNPPANAGDVGSILRWGRSPGEGNGNPVQHSSLGNPMGREAWWATVHDVSKRRTQLKHLSMHTCILQ